MSIEPPACLRALMTVFVEHGNMWSDNADLQLCVGFRI